MTILSSKRKVAKKAINDKLQSILECMHLDQLIQFRLIQKNVAKRSQSDAAIYDKEIRRRRKLARVAP